MYGPGNDWGYWPTAAFSLQALLNNSFESIFGVVSTYGTNNDPMHFRHLFSEGTQVVDHALMEIKDENLYHQSALDGLSSLSIAAMVERLALPTQQNVASLHAALVASALIMDDTMNQLKKAKLALQMLARHNNIINDATQRRLNEAEASIWLIEHDVANALALETQHGQLVTLEFRVKKVKEEGMSTVGQL